MKKFFFLYIIAPSLKQSFAIIFILIHFSVFPQGKWTQKADFGGTARYGAVGFSIANKGYIGMGYDGVNHNDFWEWDQTTDTWTQKANCPGAVRRASVGFSIGSKGYISVGYNGNFFNDLWEWNQATNTWTQKSNIPANGRYGSGSFVIGNKGYIGCGNGGNLNGPYFNELWEWDQGTDSWAQKADYPGGPKYGVSGFAVGTKGYLGFGYDNNITTFYNDLWEWDQATNSWSQKANLPCNARHYAVSFSIGTKGYVGLGEGSGLNISGDFWEFDPATNFWEQKANFGGGNRNIASGFSIGSKGYIGIGVFSVGFKDFWEYDSLSLAISTNNVPCVNTVNFSSNIPGADSYLWNFGDGTTSTLPNPAKSYNSDGNYNVMLIVFWSCSSDTVYQSVSINSSFFSSHNLSICDGDSIFLQGNYQTTAGVYFDTLTAVNGCDSVVATTILVYLPVSDNKVLGICVGDSVFLQGSYQTTSGIYYDTLSSVNFCDSILETSLSVNPVYDIATNTSICNGSTFPFGTQTLTSSGSYLEIFSSVDGCDSTVTLLLSVTDTIKNNISAAICNGDSIFIQGNNQTLPGTYFDTLATVGGCDSIITCLLNVMAGPEFSGYDTTIVHGTTINLYASGGVNYLWTTGDTLANISVSPLETTAYLVTITDVNGCTDVATITITIDDSPHAISVPSVFSPNRDGINDFIKVHGYGVKEYTFVVYDRWGEKVFEAQESILSSGITGGASWDGTFSGKQLNSAVFVYLLDAVFIDGKEFHEKGNITLLK